jgi:heterodisulfide reductase subunit A-like polyferredoxin
MPEYRLQEYKQMAASREIQAPFGVVQELEYDAIIIGAGISGLYQLYRLRELGMRVRVLEAPGIGTAIRARASIPKAIPTAIPFQRNCSTNGTGPSISPGNLRRCDTSITSPTSLTCAVTSSSAAG